MRSSSDPTQTQLPLPYIESPNGLTFETDSKPVLKSKRLKRYHAPSQPIPFNPHTLQLHTRHYPHANSQFTTTTMADGETREHYPMNMAEINECLEPLPPQPMIANSHLYSTENYLFSESSITT